MRGEGKSVGQMMRWGYFVLPVPFSLPSRGESGGLASDGVSFLFFCLFFALTSSFSFSFALGNQRARAQKGRGEVRGWTLRAGAGIGPEVPGASEAPAGGGKLPEDGGGGRW